MWMMQSGRQSWFDNKVGWISKMTSSLNRLGSQVRGLLNLGFFHIVGAGTINRIISTLLSIVLVRVLSKYDYGVYSYAYNIVSYFIIFNGLGVTSAALQLCCEYYADQKRSHAIFRYAFIASWAIGVLFLIIIAFGSLIVPLSIPSAAPLLLLYCAYPLFQQLCDIKTTEFRIRLDNKKYALATNVQTVSLCICSISGALLGGAEGLAIGQTTALIITFLWLMLPKLRGDGRLRVGAVARPDAILFWKIALISAFNTGISQALTLLGTTLIGIISSSELMVSSYKVATTIPFALMFVPSSIVTFIYPYFVRNKDDYSWTMSKYRQLIGWSALLMGCIAAFFWIFAEPITRLVFGEQYLDTIPIFRILLIGFFLTATIRTPTGNLLVTQRRLMTNTVIGILSILICIVGSFALIPVYGMMGAAVVYVLCMLLGSVLTSVDYLKTICSLK